MYRPGAKILLKKFIVALCFRNKKGGTTSVGSKKVLVFTYNRLYNLARKSLEIKCILSPIPLDYYPPPQQKRVALFQVPPFNITVLLYIARYSPYTRHLYSLLL